MAPAESLPPQIFPVTKEPFTGSHEKLQVKGGDAAPITTLNTNGLSNGTVSGPEGTLRALWADILDVDEEEITAWSHFFELGGNSLAAAELSAAAAYNGLHIPRLLIFEAPGFANMVSRIANSHCARDASVAEEMAVQEPAPFELLKGDVAMAKRLAADACGVLVEDIEDMYPAMALQAGLMARSVSMPGVYVSSWLLDGVGIAEPAWLCKVLERAVRELPILRTAMTASAEHDFVQVVLPPLESAVEMVKVLSLQKFDPETRKPNMTLGSRLNKIEVVVADDVDTPMILWHAHHATYDMSSLELMAKYIGDIAYGEQRLVPPPSFASFVAYSLEIREGSEWRSFWSDEVRACPEPFFPYAKDEERDGDRDKDGLDVGFRTDSWHIHSLPRLSAKSSFTPANTLRAAWALLLGCYEHSDDVVFGVTNGGRYAPVRRCNEIIGPTIATTPMRVRLGDGAVTGADLLQQVSVQAVRASGLEQAGLPDIRRLGPDGHRACLFRTLLNVQTIDAANSSPLLAPNGRVTKPEPLDYALVLELFPPSDSTATTAPLHMSYDSRVLRHDQVLQIAAQLERVLGLLTVSQDKTLDEIGVGPGLHDAAPPGSGNGALEPFGLVAAAPLRVRRHAAVACGIDEHAVEDVYPCTPMQAALMTASLDLHATHVSQLVFRVRDGLCADQVTEAWAALCHWAPILRTRFFHALVGSAENRTVQLLQAVVDEDIHWQQGLNLEGYLATDQELAFRLGHRLTRFGLIHDEQNQDIRWVVLTTHRAVCDESSLPMMLRVLEGASSGTVGDLEAVPYNLFVLHALRSSSDPAAKDFWARTLKDSPTPAFPEISAGYKSVSTASFHRSISLPASASPTLLQGAWAVTLAQYYDSADVVFGLGVSLCSSHSILGPTLNVVPQRIIIGDHETTVAQFLRAVRARNFTLANYGQYGLANIAAIDESCAAACRVQNLLILHETPTKPDDSGAFLLTSVGGDKDGDPYADFSAAHDLSLVADVTPYADGTVAVRMSFDPAVLEKVQVQRLASHYEHVLRQIYDAGLPGAAGSRLRDINHLPDEHMAELQAWNSNVPAPMERGVHELFEDQAAIRPNDPAICARDGEWTFAQLDADAEHLASWLRSLGVGHGTYVPLIFEKCGLAIVAMLSVLKVGAASVALDPSHPPGRLRELIRAMGGSGGAECSVALCSADNRQLAVKLASRAAVVDKNTLRHLTERPPRPQLTKELRVPPSATAFVLFTSGSTGVPKGILIQHRAFASSIRGHAEVLRFSTGPGSRNFQFTAYTSDVSIGEIFTSLSVGSCVCVPSDWDRQNNLAGAIRELRANWAFFTPSVAALLSPVDVPELRTMVFGGETASPENLQVWAPALHLINSFGPAETSIWSHSMRRRAEIGDNGSHIGRGVGCGTWITDPDNYHRLQPIGAIGEMLVEGPNLADGYLGEPAKTAATFIHDAPWTPSCRRPTKIYRSGDLARFLPDGTVQFLGRRDHQVKLRGLRVELGEIEHQIRTHMPEGVLVAVDVVSPHLAGSPRILAAFLSLKEPELQQVVVSGVQNGVKESDAKESDPERRKAFSLLASNEKGLKQLMDALRGLEAAIGAVLPSHMVPAAFVPLREMPLTASAKTDRKALKLLASMVSVEELGRLGRTASGSQQTPSSVMERILARLWSTALAHPLDLDTRDSFFRVGGDSLSAMRLISLARKESVRLSVEQVFKHPNLREMALAATIVRENGVDQEKSDHQNGLPSGLAPFTTLGVPEAAESASHAASTQLGISQDTIEDIYGCTPLQEGLMALSQDARGSYVAQMVYELPTGVDVARFKLAWAMVFKDWPILRTRFFQWHGADGTSRLMQAVINPAPIVWARGRALLDYLKLDKRDRMQVGDSMLRLATFRDQRDSKDYFIMTAHHAIYDGWMLGLLLDALRSAYLDRPTPKIAPYSTFVSHIESANREAGQSFWQRYVGSAPRLSWPELPSPDFRPRSTLVSSRTAALPHGSWRGEFTPATLMRAAFAILLGTYSHTEDVVFASTVYGRAAGWGSAERVAGPTLATVAVRVQVGAELTVHDLMAVVQSDAADMLAHEQVGMQSIKRLNRDGLATVDAQSLLVVQVDGDEVQINGSGHGDDSGFKLQPVRVSKLENGFLSSALVLEATVSTDKVHLVTTFDDGVLLPVQVERFLRQMCHIVGQLCSSPDGKRLSDLNLTPLEDVEEMRGWNPPHLSSARTLVHELVAAEARRQPNAEALVSHEGSLTFRELDEISSQVARHLWTVCGLRPRTQVPLLFEKSIWAIVAMMAVLKVGAANVALNPAHPPDRLRSLVEDVDADFVLCSPASRTLAADVAPRSFCVDPAIFGPGSSTSLKDGSTDDHSSLKVDITPEHLAFLLFTSGSTGRPKAVMIDHTAFCSSIAGHGETLCYHRGSRNLQFTAYTSDVSIGEIFTSLSRGATVCVPSDAERMGDLAGAMERMRVDWAFLTPSVAALLDPALVPTLRTLVFGGETATPTNVRTWAPRLHLINSFGPAETSIWSHAHPGFTADDDGSDIGKPLGCATWIADPYDCSRLMPIGSIGELVAEGPNIAAGYYNNPDKTRAAFPEHLPCIPAGGSRIYRTGDLARWMPDGRVQFLGRRDGQVKLHGLKVEIGEVEHAIRDVVGDNNPEVAVELVRHPEAPDDARLVAFVSCASTDGPQDRDHAVIVTDDSELQVFSERTADIRSRLASRLAPYMIPSFFVPLISMPLTASAKTDRRLLRALVADRGFAELACFSLVPQRDVQPPQTPTEKLLQTMWCSVLTLLPTDFGTEADFFECGGDSIAAMKLASLSLAANIRFSVQDIYDNSRLADLAKVVALRHDGDDSAERPPTPPAEVEPFSLLPSPLKAKLGQLISQVAKLCLVEPEQVGDIYPCTPLQRSVVERTIARPGAYWLHNVFEIPDNVDATRLDYAWQRVAATHTVLRTRIVAPDGEHFQVVLRSARPVRFVESRATSLEPFLAADRPRGRTYGEPLLRAAIVRLGGTGPRHLVLALHHAVYDAWSLTRIFADLARNYTHVAETENGANVDGLEVSLNDINKPEQPHIGVGVDFNTFVKALLDQDRTQALNFWREYLLGAKTTPFAVGGRANCLLRHIISLPSPVASVTGPEVRARGVTHAVTVYAAVALALHRQFPAPDTMLRLVSTGRTTPSVPHIEELVGPTIAVVPLRVTHPGSGTSLREYLAHVNSQVRRVAPFEQTGLDVAASVSEDASNACRGMPQLIVQPFDPYTEQPASELGLRRRELSALDNDDDSPFTIDVSLESRGRGRSTTLDAIHLRVIFDDGVVSEQAARRFIADLDFVVRTMASSQPDASLATLRPELAEDTMEEMQRQVILERVGAEPLS